MERGAFSQSVKKLLRPRFRAGFQGLCRGGRLCPPGRKQRFFVKKYGAYVCTARFGVGADAYIGPADCTVFTIIFGKFVTSQRADVGIGPYRVLCEVSVIHRAEQIPAPTKQSYIDHDRTFLTRCEKRSVRLHGAFSVL